MATLPLPRSRLLDRLSPLLAAAAGTVRGWWRRRADRQRLLGLSDAMLKDLGLSRADVEGLAARPWWGRADGAEAEARWTGRRR